MSVLIFTCVRSKIGTGHLSALAYMIKARHISVPRWNNETGLMECMIDFFHVIQWVSANRLVALSVSVYKEFHSVYKKTRTRRYLIRLVTRLI